MTYLDSIKLALKTPTHSKVPKNKKWPIYGKNSRSFALEKLVIALMAMTIMNTPKALAMEKPNSDDFSYFSEQFSDLKILRYQIPGFNDLSLQQKKLAYYLAQAAISGRDIYWDQNYRHNLVIRRLLEQVVKNYSGDRDTDAFKKFMTYTKRVWFSNGIHHHYSNDKILPEFSVEDLKHFVAASPNGSWPLDNGEDVYALLDRISPIIFDPTIDNKKVCLDDDIDKVVNSSVNFYEGVTEEEVLDYYQEIADLDDETPISYGLNSKKIKKDSEVTEEVYKLGGLYGEAIEKIIHWLELAIDVAESDLQRAYLEKLVEYYSTGDLKVFDEHNILWVQDTESMVDVVNGFIEVYDDPLGRTGSWESVVSIKDLDATERFGKLSHEAQWFEDNSPIMPQHKRQSVVGVSYKVINVVQESGGSSPSSPIGINLPNADWIRKIHGSKSVSLGNIEHAYDQSSKRAVLDEFFLPEVKEWIIKYGDLAGRLHTGLHEVIGHASGQLEPGVLPAHDTLKSYASALEEARADLVGLYYLGDQHLVDMGVSDSTDIVKASYTRYINNGLLIQLARIEPGKNIEEAHMRNRQMIASWAYEQGLLENVIERRDLISEEGLKTYFVVNDFMKLRDIFARLLREVQRIKSQGDFEAGRALIENYGVKVDAGLHLQVKERYKKLGLAPYAGFINPVLQVVMDKDQDIIDIVPTYPDDFTEQMLYYGQYHSWLPNHSWAE